MKHVKIYSTGTCVYCHAEKKFLDEHQVPYEEIRVDADEAAAHEMIELSGQMGVPFTVISAGEKDSSPEYILGFDQPRLESALGL